ncbi:hypothetical protein GS504_01255 [Rhodococcus hoagii]|nr:hypothetical protein [Prescottella equi]NKS71699.1 hypothetical protein [Prescottella equi]
MDSRPDSTASPTEEDAHTNDDVRVRWLPLALHLVAVAAVTGLAVSVAGTAARLAAVVAAAGVGAFVTASLVVVAAERARAVGADVDVTRHRVVTLCAAALWWGCAAWAADGVAVASWLGVGTWAILAAAVDAQTGRIPIALTRSATISGCATVAVSAAVFRGFSDAIAALAAAALIYLVFVLLVIVSRGAVGMGDVRLIAALTIPLVMQSVSTWTAGLILGQLLVVVCWTGLRLLRGKTDRNIIAGPAIVAGSLIALLAVQ